MLENSWRDDTQLFISSVALALHVLLWSHIGILMRLFAAEPRKYRKTLIPLSVSQWNDLADPEFDGVGLTGFKSRANAFLLA